MKKFQNPALVAIAGTWLVLAAGMVCAAQTTAVLYNFGSVSGDPLQPSNSGIVAQGRDGNLYTTSPSGGTGTGGTVFKITPSGTVTVLYSFDSIHGATPYAGLTLGTDGNFYGGAATAGSGCCGTIFKITPSGVLTVLYNFSGAADGGVPQAPPIQGTDGNFYGTGTGGGNGYGTVYKLTPSGVLTTLYSFDVTHGAFPQSPLIQATDGNFYGTTLNGGTNGSQGVVFKITPSGKLTTVFNFDGTHGVSPIGPLVQSTDGNFYGTTFGGGTGNVGTVFRMTPTGVVTVLHSFNFSPDGGRPNAGLVEATDGNFYGATSQGGTLGYGTLYSITPGGTFMVLYNFDNTTGAYPLVTLTQRTSGLLYGDTSKGGTGTVNTCVGSGCGTFFSLNSGLGPFVGLVTTSGKVGKPVGILGQGFSNSSVVKFGGVQATSITRSGTTFISATVPVGALTGSVTVTTGATTLTSNRAFRVTPTLLSFSPTSGTVGTPVVLTGTGLTQTTKVTFGGVPATSFAVNSDSQVTANVPTGARTGKIVVTTTGGSATSKTNFTVN